VCKSSLKKGLGRDRSQKIISQATFSPKAGRLAMQKEKMEWCSVSRAARDII
jgi:hypothetical protein